MFKKMREMLTYVPLNERESWEVEQHDSCLPPATYLRIF